MDDDLRERLQAALGAGFVLEAPLGQGGFAVVYGARDVALNRPVAVKVLRPELAGVAGIRERFRREAEAMAQLRHPHVIPVYAVGSDAGLAWYVMPRVQGESLRARLDRDGRLPVAEARRILAESAAALAVAHRAGVLHRDIKPDNILLDGDERRVLLTDFGIAKAVAGPPSDDLTATGMIVGTPDYMSPEQATADELDHRSDVYSLGVVGYQMLAGELPFSGSTVAAKFFKRLTEDAPPLTRRRPDCPSDLAAAVMRCLARDPEQRWPSVEDLQGALVPGGVAPTVAERRSGALAATGVPPAIARARVTIAVVVALVLVAAITDALLSRVLLTPPLLLIGGFVLAAGYGRAWMDGYGPRDVFRAHFSGKVATPVSLDSAELGAHADVIATARNDRAALVASLARLTRGERGNLGDVLPSVDALIARAVETARQLHGLERQLDPGPEELERRLAATRAETTSAGRDQRAAVLAKRLDAVRGLIARRDGLNDSLTAIVSAVTRVRLAVEKGATSGVAAVEAEIRAALAGG